MPDNSRSLSERTRKVRLWLRFKVPDFIDLALLFILLSVTVYYWR